MAKNKFYAIKKGNGVQNKVVSSWSECKKLVEGYNSEFKSFKNKEDALKYLGIEPQKEIINLEIQNKTKQKNSFTVQISNELYSDFLNKCKSKHLSKDMILGFIINQWTYEDN